jgi:glyoxylase-like metal-dependent hydrolase (beta-lactamase superfamily II)
VEPSGSSSGAVSLVRVPYADVLVDAGVVGLESSQVEAIAWAAPTWADGAQVRVGAAVWVIESAGRRIVVDPAQAADGILRTGPDALVHQEGVAAALANAGFPRESIDTVIASHIDGIGMIAWVDGDDGWSPFFPNADVLISRREYDAIVDDSSYRPQGSDALVALHAHGVVTTVDDLHVVTPEVTIRHTGGHSPGHQIVQVASRDLDATLIGHLALSPLHCAIDDFGGHVDAQVATGVLRELRDRGQLLVGPLWPAPGAARWTNAEMRAELP